MEELIVKHDGVSLAATYSPAGATALVALHGAGAGTRDYFLYRNLHEILPPAGIGVVTFDRRGEGQSTGDASRGRFEVQAQDALAVCSVIDVPRVGLWGVSQGGWIAPLAASQSRRVAFVVGIASTGVTPSEQMMYAVAQQLERARYGNAVVQRVLALRRVLRGARARLRGRAARRSWPRELARAMEEPWWLLAFLPPVPLDARVAASGSRRWTSTRVRSSPRFACRR